MIDQYKNSLPSKAWRAAVLAVSLSLSATVASATVVKLTAKTDGGDKPKIVGSTNLPAGTILMISISRPESSYRAQSKVRVDADGTFTSEQFSLGTSGLNPGTYALEVMTPLEAMQPEATAAFMGKKGSKLEGPLVGRSSLGGKIIELNTKFKIGNGAGSANKDKAARAQSQANKHEWWLQSCKDTCAMTQRAGRDFDACYSTCAAGEPAGK